MVLVLSCTGIVAVGLLIYALMLVFELDGFISRTSAASDSVRKLRTQTPRPGTENEERIKKDIAVYRKAADGLRGHFQLPLQSGVDKFIAKLAPPSARLLTQDDIEKFRVPPKEDEDVDDENNKKKPIVMRKLKIDEFKELFKTHFDRMMENRQEHQRSTVNSLREFVVNFGKIFPNWNDAVNEFSREVKDKKLTDEPITDDSALALLFATMGFPRAVADDAKFSHLVNFRDVLMNKAHENKLALMPSALDLLVKWSTDGRDTDFSAYSVANRRVVLFHWDVFGNIIDLLHRSKINVLHNVHVRNYAEQTPEAGINLQQTFTEEGDYQIYHYTIEVAGTMEAIRALTRNFDLEHSRNRTYIVRAVTLYAEENGAAVLMKQGLNAAKTQQETPAEETVVRRRGRGRGRSVAADAPAAENKEKVDEEENVYGSVIVGAGNEFRAFIDVDYIVLKSNQ